MALSRLLHCLVAALMQRMFLDLFCYVTQQGVGGEQVVTYRDWALIGPQLGPNWAPLGAPIGPH